ncbi:MAG: hypothetical protein ACYC60_16320 [Thermoanaerobaculia bacterium]
MIRRSAALLLVAVLLAAALAGGVPVAAIPIVGLGLVVVASPSVHRCDLSGLPVSPALLALVSSHRLPRASLIPRHI